MNVSKYIILSLCSFFVNSIFSQSKSVKSIEALRYVEDQNRIRASYKKEYNQKKDDLVFLTEYLNLLSIENDSKTIDKIHKQYVKHFPRLDSLEWMNFVYDNVYKEKSPLFKLLESNKKSFIDLYGKDKVDDKLLDIAYESVLCRSCNNFVSHMMSKVRKKLEKYNADIDEEELLIYFASEVFTNQELYKKDIKRTNLAFKVLKDYLDKVDLETKVGMISSIVNHRDDYESFLLAFETLTMIEGDLPDDTLFELSTAMRQKAHFIQKPEVYKSLAKEFTISDSAIWYTDFDKAVAKAKQENKGVFAYVTRNRYSKDYFFKLKSISNLIHSSFIPVVLKDIPQRFTTRVTRYNYPCLIFYTAEKEQMHRSDYKRDVFELQALIEFAITNPSKRLKKFRSEFKTNRHNPEFIKRYISFADSLGNKPLVKDLTEKYIGLEDQIGKEEWMDFVLENIYSEQSIAFKKAIEHKRSFYQKYGEETINQLLLRILSPSLPRKKYSLDIDDYNKRIMENLKEYDLYITDKFIMPFAASIYAKRSEIFRRDDGAFAQRILKNYRASLDNETMQYFILSIAVNSDNEEILSLALTEVDKLISLLPNFNLYNGKSLLQYKLGFKEEAYKTEALAIELAKRENASINGAIQIMKSRGYVK